MASHAESLALLARVQEFFRRPGAWELPGMDPGMDAPKSLWWACCDFKDRQRGEAHFLEALAALADTAASSVNVPRRTSAHQDELRAWEYAEGRTQEDVVCLLRMAAIRLTSGGWVQNNAFSWERVEGVCGEAT